MNTTQPRVKPLPLGVRAAAAFLLLNGAVRIFGLLWRLAKAETIPSLSLKVVSYYCLSVAIALLFIFAGITVFRRRASSRKFAMGMLGYAAYLSLKKLAAVLFYAPMNFTALILVLGLLTVTVLLFICLWGRTAREALPRY